MKSDLIILSEGMEALKEKLGIIDSEKFISLINRNSIDYTEWRKSLWEDKSVEEIFEMIEEKEKQ